MGKKLLLDCTLRDGGYINDWEFGQGHLISLFERLTDAGVDIVEVGFLDERRPFDINRSIGPDTASLKKIWGLTCKRPPMVVGMIDFGTCSLPHIEPASESFLDGIRVIFKKQKMHPAMAFCAELKKLGYKVFSQLVSITSYTDEDLMELIGLVNEVEPYAVSVVDTYGLLTPPKLLHYAGLLNKHVKTSIGLGFHAHNNFQLAFANAQAFLAMETEHDIVVDGTLFGMGKSAGNAPLELVAMHYNEHYGKSYDIRPMLEAIEDTIMPIGRTHVWGYQQFFFMVAKEKCHPNYLTYFKRRGDLSQSDLDTLLSLIEPDDRKLLYDEAYAKELYDDFVLAHYNDADSYRRLGKLFEGKDILLVGPGKNIRLQRDIVDSYIRENNPVVIAVNYLPPFHTDYVFLTKTTRYEDITIGLHEHPETRIIATSNMNAKTAPFAFTFTREPLLEENATFKDNSFLMFLKVLQKAGVKKVACAGFDGYSPIEDNYIDPTMEYDFVKPSARILNFHVYDALKKEFADMDVHFVTYSHYVDAFDVLSAAD